MILPNPKEAFHKAQMYRLLIKILDHPLISHNVYFKGGTAAAMLGWLDRYSIDLDFDLKKNADVSKIDKELGKIFQNLDLTIDNKSDKTLFYILKYSSPSSHRNSIKLSLIDFQIRSNKYQPYLLPEINRFAFCQTVETMFANKLVAIIDRYQKRKMIAGRDLYDIHHFFIQGFRYLPEVIVERTGRKPIDYFKKLKDFIEKKVSEKMIAEDLIFLLPKEKFLKIKKVLRQEVIMFLSDEIRRVKDL